MAKAQVVKEVNIATLISHADTSRMNPPIYSNHVQMTLAGNELIIDFYQILAGRDTTKANPELSLLQRVLLPNAIAKGFAAALVNIILSTESLVKDSLPDQRNPQETDKVDLWQLLNQHLQQATSEEP